MVISNNQLFHQGLLSGALQGQLAAVQKEVDSISKDQFLANSDNQIVDKIFKKLRISPLIIYRERATRSEPKDLRISHLGSYGHLPQTEAVIFEVSIPYTGESDLWKYQPSKFSFNPPMGKCYPQRGNTQAGDLHFKMEFDQREFQVEIVNQEIENNIKTIEEYLGWIKRDLEVHDPRLQEKIIQQVAKRRERLGAIHSVAESIIIPLQIQDGTPSLLKIPLQMKIIEPLKTIQASQKEYGIENQDYENILSIIRHMGGTFERTPQTYSVHDEEELRDILLASLNGYYKNLATGEAFRNKGKTDICIEFEKRAAFIAECKLWKGDQYLAEAIGQLLGYLTWRDCKTALVNFNKEVAGFAKLQEKIRKILLNHSNYVNDEITQHNSEWRMVFRSLNDQDRLVTVHVFLFDLFVKT